MRERCQYLLWLCWACILDSWSRRKPGSPRNLPYSQFAQFQARDDERSGVQASSIPGYCQGGEHPNNLPVRPQYSRMLPTMKHSLISTLAAVLDFMSSPHTEVEWSFLHGHMLYGEVLPTQSPAIAVGCFLVLNRTLTTSSSIIAESRLLDAPCRLG